MSRDWRLYLEDVERYAAAALRITEGMTRDEVFGDERTRFAVLHALEVVGEAVKRVPAEIRGRAPDVPWGQIAGFRDRLAHAYWQVQEDVVWDVLRRDLAPLRDISHGLLAEADRTSAPGG